MTMSITNNASQATQVEMARAIAEVLASVQAAHDHPRDEDISIARFMRSCARREFAERAFFRFPRSGKQVTGPTIDFALEALRCWGNATSGSAELVRRAGESEMVAFAQDLETNAARRTTFVSPHTGYTDTPTDKDGNPTPVRELVAVRDIRENNQSAGSRVEREMILSALPVWFIEMGKAACYQTMQGNTSEPIEDRRRALVENFAGLGVRREELVMKIGAPVASWVDADLAALRIIGASIHRGETSVAAEFRNHEDAPAAARVSAADLAGAGVSTPGPDETAQGTTAADAPAVDTEPDKIDKVRLNELFALMNGAGLTGKSAAVRARRLRLCEILTDRTLTSSTELTPEEGANLAVIMRGWGDRAAEVAAEMLEEDDRQREIDAAEADSAIEASGDDA